MNWREKRRSLIGKILHRPRGLRAVIGVRRHLHLAHRVRFRPKFILHDHSFSERRLPCPTNFGQHRRANPPNLFRHAFQFNLVTR